MTNEELADALDARAKRTMSTKAQKELREAAQRLRDMPEGERIEGIVVEESRDMRGVVRIVFEQRAPDMADPTGYAGATVTIHERKEGESDE